MLREERSLFDAMIVSVATTSVYVKNKGENLIGRC